MTHNEAARRVLDAFATLQDALDDVPSARPPADGCDRLDWQDFVRETQAMGWTVKLLADLAESLRPARRAGKAKAG